MTTTSTNIIERDWARLGVLFGCGPSGDTPDLDRLLLAAARACPGDARLLPVVVTWLVEYGGFVARHRLKRLVQDELAPDTPSRRVSATPRRGAGSRGSSGASRSVNARGNSRAIRLTYFRVVRTERCSVHIDPSCRSLFESVQSDPKSLVSSRVSGRLTEHELSCLSLALGLPYAARDNVQAGQPAVVLGVRIDTDRPAEVARQTAALSGVAADDHLAADVRSRRGVHLLPEQDRRILLLHRDPRLDAGVDEDRLWLLVPEAERAEQRPMPALDRFNIACSPMKSVGLNSAPAPRSRPRFE